VEDFKITRSYAVTGRNFGVSRQRVQQVIDASGINVKPRTAHFVWVGTKCNICGITLTKKTKHRAGYCLSCYNKLAYRLKGKEQRSRKKLRIKGGVIK